MLEIFDKLKKNVCRVFLNEKGNGTGFLISNKFILTDYHVIDETSSIEVKFDDNEDFYKVTLYKTDSKYKDLDIALLELEKEVDFYEYIEVEDRRLKRDERWITRGYPATKNGRVENMKNNKHIIHEIFSQLDDEGFDIELNFDTSKWSFYGGLSGSPIVVNDCIVGIITSEQIDERSKELYGLSAKYFIKLIDEVRKKEQEDNKITNTLKNGKSIELVKVKLDDNRTLYVGKYPVTFEEYDLFCEETNQCKKGEPLARWGRGKQPVINVNWNYAKEYCTWLTKKSNFTFDLLCHEDWLIIANMNIPDSFLSNYDIWHNKKKATCLVNVGGEGELGICHMYGNVYEWCLDKFNNEYIAYGGSFRVTNIKKFLSVEGKQILKSTEIGFRVVGIIE